MRYRLLETVQRLMYAPGLPPDRQNRICACHWRRTWFDVEVRRKKAGGRAYYAGIETCSNVWACPVCSDGITEGRRGQIQSGAGKWKKQGGECYLCTGTFPHERRDNLRWLIQRMRRAANYFNTSKAVRAARKAAGYVGQIRVLEVTWGSWHGWHPHFHFLYFCRPGHQPTLRALETAWCDALIKAGLAERSQLNDMLHGAAGEAAAWDVKNGDYAAEYMAKFGHEPSFRSRIETGETWGIARELTKGASKLGRRLRGLTPFTLLAVAGGVCDVPGMTAGRAAALFCEFISAFRGQRQLYWSPGLARTLQIGRLFTDEELDDFNRTRDTESVARIAAEDWALVLGRRKHHAVLRAAEEGGKAGIEAYLRELRAQPPPPRDSRLSRELPDGSHTIALDTPR